MKKNIESNNSKKIYDSFEKIYLQYGKLVCFKIMEYIKDQSIAEDLMQDVFLSFFNNYDGCDGRRMLESLVRGNA